MKTLFLTALLMIFSITANANYFTSFTKMVVRQFASETTEELAKKAPKLIVKEMASEQQDDFYIVASAFFAKSEKLTLSELQGRTSLSPMEIKFIVNRNKNLFVSTKYGGEQSLQVTPIGMRVYRRLESHLNSDTVYMLEELAIGNVNNKKMVDLKDLTEGDEQYYKKVKTFVRHNQDLVELTVVEDGGEAIRFTDDAMELFPQLK